VHSRAQFGSVLLTSISEMLYAQPDNNKNTRIFITIKHFMYIPPKVYANIVRFNRKTKPHLYEKWGLNNRSSATSWLRLFFSFTGAFLAPVYSELIQVRFKNKPNIIRQAAGIVIGELLQGFF
jgi:hypothetical protein